MRDHSVCVGLQANELYRLAELTTVLEGKPGEILFFEGDPSRHFFTIRKGVVRLVRAFPDGRRSIIGFLHDGDFLGGRFGERSYQATAEAITDIEYCRILTSDLRRLTEEFPGLEHQLLAMSADRMTAAENHIVLLSRKTAIEKVAAFLLACQEKEDAEVPPDRFELPMSRTDIADYLGLTIETISRVMAKLADSSLISIRDARQITVNNQVELNLLARPEAVAFHDD